MRWEATLDVGLCFEQPTWQLSDLELVVVVVNLQQGLFRNDVLEDIFLSKETGRTGFFGSLR